MSPNTFANLDPDQTVNVLPRHLAGPGPASPRTAWPFPFDGDWSLHQPEEGRAMATSPCLRLRAGYAPAPHPASKALWTTAAHRDPFAPATWQITFETSTPVELLHDVHTELLDLYLEDGNSQDRLFEDDTAPHEAYAPLLARGWSHSVKTNGRQYFRTPDALGVVEHRYARPSDSSVPAWTAWCGDSSRMHWRARFSAGVPTTLVAAFTASLISTSPVRRTVKDIPLHTRDHLYIAAATTPAKQAPLPSTVAKTPPGQAPRRTR